MLQKRAILVRIGLFYFISSIIFLIMKKSGGFIIPLIIILIAAGIIGAFVYTQKSSDSDTDTDDDAMMDEGEMAEGDSMKVPAPGFEDIDEMIVDDAMMEGEGDAMMKDEGSMMDNGGSPTVAVVTYTNNGFSPSSVTINVGDTVRFVNESGRSFWPASAFHPTHTAYPDSDVNKCGTGAELNIFDACKALASGASYSFIFTEKGSWNYHDHLNASRFGSVVVK